METSSLVAELMTELTAGGSAGLPQPTLKSWKFKLGKLPQAKWITTVMELTVYLGRAEKIENAQAIVQQLTELRDAVFRTAKRAGIDLEKAAFGDYGFKYTDAKKPIGANASTTGMPSANAGAGGVNPFALNELFDKKR